MTEKTKSTAVAARPAPLDAEEVVTQLMESAKTPQERERAFLIQDAITQSKLVRRAASLVAATEWGGTMSPVKQAAFARYCLALGADPLRHVDLLSGNVFVNGDYFRDVIAANPDFDYADDPDWIHDDLRLTLCASCGKPFDASPAHGHENKLIEEENVWRITERIRRARARVEHNADEASPAICVLVLHYKKDRGPFKGIGEVHPGKLTKHKEGRSYEVDRDPIGVQSPRGTAETRAWREAGEKAEATWFRTHAATLDQLAGRVRDAHASEKLGQVEEREPEHVTTEAVEVKELGSGAPVVEGQTEEEPGAEKTVRHNPNAICGIDGPHAAADCKMEKNRRGEA